MRSLVLTLGVVILTVNFSLAQSNVKIIVLPQHKENFNKTIASLKEDESFKDKVDFVKSFEEAFKYAKAGDYENYTHWVQIYGSELSKLSDSEKNKFESFLAKLPIPDISIITKEYRIMEEPGVSCVVTCTYGSCVAYGCSRAKCMCVGGYPVYECE